MIFFILWRKKDLTDFIEAIGETFIKEIKKHEKKHHPKKGV